MSKRTKKNQKLVLNSHLHIKLKAVTAVVSGTQLRLSYEHYKLLGESLSILVCFANSMVIS